MKDHAIYGNSHTTRARTAARGIRCGKIHLRHQPTSEYVAGRIGIRRHGNGADQRFTVRSVRWSGHMVLTFSRSDCSFSSSINVDGRGDRKY